MLQQSEERLQKVLSRAGVASRRQCERMIVQGRVKVNGETVRELGRRVHWPAADLIEVDGKPLAEPEEKVYVMLNKPSGFITSLQDSQGRPKVVDLVKEIPFRLYPVGRLDFETEGLLLLTNDGDLCYRLTHPRFKVEKTYQAEVMGVPQPQKIQRLSRGVMLEDGMTAPARVRVVGRRQGNGILEVTLHEGRKRQVRRMFEAIGHPVLRLKRTRFGGLSLGELKAGAYRQLTEKEVEFLKNLTDLGPPAIRKDGNEKSYRRKMRGVNRVV